MLRRHSRPCSVGWGVETSLQREGEGVETSLQREVRLGLQRRPRSGGGPEAALPSSQREVGLALQRRPCSVGCGNRATASSQNLKQWHHSHTVV